MSPFLYSLPLILALYLLTEHYLVHKIKNLPPKPFSLPIIGHLLFLKKPLHRTLSKLSETHGPLIYLQLGSRRAVVASSSSIVDECLSKNDIVFANRPSFLIGRCLGYNNSLVSLSPYGDRWRNLRRIFSVELLSASRLAATSGVRVDEVRSLVRRLYRDGNRTVNMRTAFSEVLLNILTMMIAGRRYYGENITHNEDAKKFREAQEENFRLTGVTNIGDYLPWVRPRKWLVESLAECARKRDEFAKVILDGHHQKRKTEGDCSMVRFLLSMAEKQPHYYTDAIIKGIILIKATLQQGKNRKAKWLESFLRRTFFDPCTAHPIRKNEKNRYFITCNLSACQYCMSSGNHRYHKILIKIYRHVYKDVVCLSAMENYIDCSQIQTTLSAGSDTSINTMEWAMSLLVNHPEALDKAQQEIDKQIGNDRLIEETDLSNLPYLRAIIRETMRMYPVLPLLIPHLSSEDCVVGGYTIPRGTMLFVNVWAIQNDPEQWADPTKFKPERFEGEPDGIRDVFRMLPFGSGRRSCPGEGLALRMMGLLLGSLVHCFEWARVSGELVDMSEGLGITMPKRQPLTLVCGPRPKMAKLLSQL